MNQVSVIFKKIASGSLVAQIMMGIIAGVILAVVSPAAAKSAGLLGGLFVGGLKAVAPTLVFVIVMASIANQKKGAHTNMRSIILLYLAGTFMAALVAVTMSFLFPHLPRGPFGTAMPAGVLPGLCGSAIRWTAIRIADPAGGSRIRSPIQQADRGSDRLNFPAIWQRSSFRTFLL